MGIAAVTSISQAKFSEADEGDYTLFLGKATPPTSYGGMGGDKSLAIDKYTFEYPSSWKIKPPSKVEKGSLGIDGQVINPKVKGQRVVVITFGRDGEDRVAYKLGDVDMTLRGFAGADAELMQAFESAVDVSNTAFTRNNSKYYSYVIDSPDLKYRGNITVNGGKMFAMFVKTPSKAWEATKADVDHILRSFQVYD